MAFAKHVDRNIVHATSHVSGKPGKGISAVRRFLRKIYLLAKVNGSTEFQTDMLSVSVEAISDLTQQTSCIRSLCNL